ncbi:MAG TPA: lamin tail domain-containing protein [Polyangiaceae bacterium]|nr:lamin tail domain-containing protein [Polyangiaceae bacterium]
MTKHFLRSNIVGIIAGTLGLVAIVGCGDDGGPGLVDDVATEHDPDDAGSSNTQHHTSTDGGPTGDSSTLEDAGAGADDPTRDDTPTTEDQDAGNVVFPPIEDSGTPGPLTLAFNEVMPKNDGAWIDETGETDDWIEIVNASDQSLKLTAFTIEDSSGERVAMPDMTLEPRQGVVLWADNQLDQGKLHLPFKLDSDADSLVLRSADGRVVDRAEWEALEPNQALARFPDATGDWAVCRYATPRHKNGKQCQPPNPPTVDPTYEFQDFSFPKPFPAPAGSLVLTELGLRPAKGSAFVEIMNRSDSSLNLDDYTLRISHQGPGETWPDTSSGTAIALPADTNLRAGERISVEVSSDALETLEADAAFEGVVTLFDTDGNAVERMDFMRWPEGATFTRLPDADGIFRFCKDSTPGKANECDPVLSRDVGDRVRHIDTPGDFSALSDGDTQLGMESVKFILDMEAGGVVHLLGSKRWPLHYTFIREQIYLEPELDRCDPDQGNEFYQGWVDFSRKEYFVSEGRRFLLGTLTKHGGSGLQAVEYAQGDAIVGEQMKTGFFAAVTHTDNPTEWVLHPADSEQADRALEVDGELPIVDPNAPYEGLTYQPLTEGVAYGTLKFVPADQLKSVALGPDVVLVTDDVPNDIPFVGGLITEAFQTPLAHVNVLSQNRGTPNAALKDARTVLQEYLDKLVKVEVQGVELKVEPADPAEAQAFWDSQVPDGPALSPRLDTSVRGVQPLTEHGLSSLPAIGAKAAQLAELGKVDMARAGCSTATVPIPVPEGAFAIPLVHYLEHFEASGAKDMLAEFEQNDDFVKDPVARAQFLEQVQEAILTYPVDKSLLDDVTAAIKERFGETRLRFRSSSNTEDLPGFNGAGLYTSKGLDVDTDGKGVDDSIRTVWASLWNPRAYDERHFSRIENAKVAMGVLVQPAFPSEEANGVAVSRDVLDPGRGDIYYINAQVGEAAVTNPAPAVTTEEMVYQWGRSPLIMYQSHSSLLSALTNPPATVLTEAETTELACTLGAIHEWFEPLLNPDGENPWFAMEVEYKFIGSDRHLMIKQTRPFIFPNLVSFGDCREL